MQGNGVRIDDQVPDEFAHAQPSKRDHETGKQLAHSRPNSDEYLVDS